MNKVIICIILLLNLLVSNAQSRWTLNQDGSISWYVKENDSHKDHIEMAGLKVATVLRYGVSDSGAFLLNRSMVWPMLRTIPNNTHASLMRRFAMNVLDQLTVNGQSMQKERVKKITLNGTMVVESEFSLPRNGSVELKRILFPSVTKPAFCEKYNIRNLGKVPIAIEIPSLRSELLTDPQKGVDGSYRLLTVIEGQAYTVLQPGDEISFSATFAGYSKGASELELNIDDELEARKALVASLYDNLILETPDSVLNTMFSFAKIRGSESIYETKGGLMHGPGGESYYAAIWANDQAEYINPFFPFLGYEIANKSAINAYSHFARFMNPEYKPIPSSIIAEGIDIWAGAGDRGDAAMIAYGASRYALVQGDKAIAEQLWPLIEWCLEYCHRKLNEDGVVASDSDELEGRFPAGEANLCTSSLYYDALRSAAYLAKDLGKQSSLLLGYTRRADILRKNIESYFGAVVEGFDTYQYYKGNDVLRSWICIPLTVGIDERKDGTIKALFSPRLWSKDGLLTQGGSETFWDRSTLYALRGIFACGEIEKAIEYLKYYSGKRLLGDHVPYPIEAWPEGNQRHLSAESGLYCRIFIEGMFGIRPTGLRSFTLTPRLPKTWNEMALRNIKAFGSSFDIEVEREGAKILLKVIENGKIVMKKKMNDGQTYQVSLKK